MALTRQALNFDGTKPSFVDGKGHDGFGFRNKANFPPDGAGLANAKAMDVES
jgi:hypothetical protein